MSSTRLAALTLVGVFCMQSACFADSVDVRGLLEDTKLYFTAPVRWDRYDWMDFGISLAAIGAAHEFDSRVRNNFAVGSRAVLDGQDKNSLRDALPAAALVAGTWVYAGILGDSDGYHETRSLLEAGAFSVVSGEALKFATGRERPNVTTSPNQWGQGGSAFPSVHTSAAFAIGTVFAESGNDEYRWVRRIVGYGIASGTAYIRLRDNVHWLSDTVAGAALGIATARFVLNRDGQGHSNHASIHFEPQKDGWMLAYTAPITW
jgi:membrane-associated phospholipid phosphatase